MFKKKPNVRLVLRILSTRLTAADQAAIAAEIF